LATYLLFDNKGVIARVRLESQKKELEQKILQAEAETKALQAQIKALEGDKKTIEKIAREKYGMARDGETVYRVKKD
jgi:cell division protein FtsB